MPASRRTRAIGRVALCVALAGWVLAVVDFVAPGVGSSSGPKNFRGAAELQRLGVPAQESPQAARPVFASVAAFAAALTIAATLTMSTPVVAEDDESVSSAATIAGASSRKKKRREAQVAEAKKEEKPKAEEGGGFSLNLDLFKTPASSEPAKPAPVAIQTSSEAAPVVPFKKNFINPSDERDLDEIPLTATNIPLLTAFIFGPSFVFLGFWVLGSLEII